MIDLLREYTPGFLLHKATHSQVKSTLGRVLLCRTATLRGHVYECPNCHSRKHVYNSCGDRHCPQCSGARRADWLEKTSVLVLPQVNYFQVVFTLPDKLSRLILGNRRAIYDLLFHAAWQALNTTLREVSGEQGDELRPAAHLVLHT